MAGVILTGCSGGSPEVWSLARAFSRNGAEAAAVFLSNKGHELENLVDEYGAAGKQWLCFVAEHSTYDKATGHVNLPTEADIEQKVLSTILPAPAYKTNLNNFYKTLEAVNNRELAKAAVDAGCSVG